MNGFVIFCIGFVVGAWIAMLITTSIVASHQAEERERQYWDTIINQKEEDE